MFLFLFAESAAHSATDGIEKFALNRERKIKAANRKRYS